MRLVCFYCYCVYVLLYSCFDSCYRIRSYFQISLRRQTLPALSISAIASINSSSSVFPNLLYPGLHEKHINTSSNRMYAWSRPGNLSIRLNQVSQNSLCNKMIKTLHTCTYRKNLSTFSFPPPVQINIAGTSWSHIIIIIYLFSQFSTVIYFMQLALMLKLMMLFIKTRFFFVELFFTFLFQPSLLYNMHLALMLYDLWDCTPV